MLSDNNIGLIKLREEVSSLKAEIQRTSRITDAIVNGIKQNKKTFVSLKSKENDFRTLENKFQKVEHILELYRKVLEKSQKSGINLFYLGKYGVFFSWCKTTNSFEIKKLIDEDKKGIFSKTRPVLRKLLKTKESEITTELLAEVIFEDVQDGNHLTEYYSKLQEILSEIIEEEKYNG